jgi:anaerobic magnesium-protoporphyrin IX monomethyl ester cyclase
MAKVLLINPIIREETDPRHVPYGLAIMAAIADQRGHDVQVLDANAYRPTDEDLKEALEADQWDIVATGGITTAYGYIKKAGRFVRKYSPDSLIVAGGGFLTSMPHDIMRFLPEIDVGVVGEGFVTWPEILRCVEQRKHDWAKVAGIIHRTGNGGVRLTPARPLVSVEQLDRMPYPAWEFFPLDTYFRNSCVLLSEEAMQAKRRLDINGSYGCSLICRFCFHLGLTGDLAYTNGAQGPDVTFTHDRLIRWHSPRYIVNMVKYLRERFGVDFISFLDENLMTMNVSTHGTWIPEICDLWIKEGLQPRCIREGIPHDPETCDGVHWGGTSHATLVRPEVLKRMREAGCSYLDYGLETFSDRVLKTIGKGATAKTNESGIRMTMEAGIRPIPNQIIGFPDEFFDSIRDSVNAWERTGIVANPFFATPYPGSEWFYVYKKRILEQYDGNLEAFLLDLGDATKITAVISANFGAVELLGLRELMVRRDLKRINEYENKWRKMHGEPQFPEAERLKKSPPATPSIPLQKLA